MKKVVFQCLGLILIISLSTSCGLLDNPCSSKESLQKAMDEIVVAAEENSKKSGRIDWSKLDTRFDKCVQRCYISLKDDMSAQERIGFYKDVLSYVENRNSSRYEIDRILEDAGISLKQELSELGDEGKKELERLFREELIPELESVIDDVLKEVESFGKELKEELDNLSKE